jgi:hypothetical protein
MTSDVELWGVRIPPGTSSSCILERDPAEFTDPDEFRLNRGLRNEVAFGMGIHYCLGASPSGAMKPPVSPNASWTVFRVQTSSELLQLPSLYLFQRSF